VDHLSTLPPELIGVIYDNFASDAKHHFLPIVRSLLPSQRINLYRQVVIRSKLAFAKFCRTLNGINGIELGGMVVKLDIWHVVIVEEGEEDDEDIESEGIMTESLVQSILPKLTRLIILKVNPPPAARPIIPFFSTPTSLPGTSTIVTLQLRLEDYSQLHLILPLFPNLLDLSLELPPYSSALGLESTAPEALPSSTLQPRQLNDLFIRGNFTVPSVCQIVASTESKTTILWGVAVHNALRVLRNSERMESLDIRCNYGHEASQDHGRALVKFTRVTELSLGRQINVERTFFTDLFKSNPGLKLLTLADEFPLVASDLLSAIRTNPIAGLHLRLHCVDGEDEYGEEIDVDDVAWPDGCEAEDVRAIMAWGALARMDVTGSAVDIIDRLNELEYDEFYENRNPSEDDDEGDEEEEEEEYSD
jgi:hypothetical protein